MATLTQRAKGAVQLAGAAETVARAKGAVQVLQEAAAGGGRIMGSLAANGGLAGQGGIAGKGGGLAG